jgi:hypothetical protein
MALVIKAERSPALHFQFETPKLNGETFLISLTHQARAKRTMNRHAGPEDEMREIDRNHGS